MFTYETQGNGYFVTIYAPDGRDVFLQGDDAIQLLDDIDGLADLDDDRAQMIQNSMLSEYFA
jgi:hypothetical protein